MAEKVHTPEQVAEHLHLSVEAVRDFLRKGRIRGFKIGKHWRVKDSDLQAYIDAQIPSEPEPGDND